jgi:uncharacterized protein YndB with AHSA1/START domain
VTTPPTAPAGYAAQITLGSPPEDVFDALTTVTGIAGWWTPQVCEEAGELRLGFPNSDGPNVVLGVSARRPKTVTWRVVAVPPLPAWEEWTGTTITFDLRPSPTGGTLVDFRHHGLTPRLECYEVCSGGWQHSLASLRGHVDAGAGRPFA